MKQLRLLLLIQTFELCIGSKRRGFVFPEPPAELPPIPVFSFYNQRHQDVRTKMGPKDAERLRCRRESITMDVDPGSGSDYRITRYRTLENNKEGLGGNYKGYLSALITSKTEKDSHAGLDIRSGSNEVVGREFLLFADEAALCGVFYVTEFDTNKPDMRHGPMCLLRVKRTERMDDAKCRQTFYKCLNHTKCFMDGVGGSDTSCKSITYMCKQSLKNS